MNDMHGQTVLVTGGTSGIGLVAARELTWLGARVVIVGRNIEKTKRVVDDIKRMTQNGDVQYLIGDLSSLEAVRQLAIGFRKRYDRLNVLVNNAGAISFNRELSDDGYEMTLAVNHLAPFLLTNLLLDMLAQSGNPQRRARVVNVSSGAHRGGKIDFEDLQMERKYSAFGAYSNSKLAFTMFSYELARRIAERGLPVTANSLHPGFVATGFGKQSGGFIGVLSKVVMGLARPLAISPEKGARTTIYLAASGDVEGVSGKYFEKEKEAASSPASMNQEEWKRLWKVSEELVALTADSPV
ncbi:MAG TPA: SDR family oxidoreductase [Spirochaetia bacterium]|nr:SDR family oxidoreductase [Spirochaetia bacterium]